MGACLSDNDLSALNDGSADAGQTDEWNRHIASCDRCAGRLFRKQRATGQSEPPDPDETVTVQAPGKADLDAGGALEPPEATPGYGILKELHRRARANVRQFRCRRNVRRGRNLIRARTA